MEKFVQQLVALKNRRQLIASYSLAPKKSRSWIVFIPESGSDFRYGRRSELKKLVGTQAAPQYNFLVINKPGIYPGSWDDREFESSFRRQRRIDDALTTLRTVIPKGHKIHLVGYSEGAYLAPQIGRLDKRVKTICMIGGGTRGWLKEELSNAKGREKEELRKIIDEIHKKPSAQLKWNGFSYATWFSYRGDHALQALRLTKVPVLAILGARDRVIDLKSTIVDLVFVSENKEIQIHVFGNCGHHFTRHWPRVCKVMGRFLADH